MTTLPSRLCHHQQHSSELGVDEAGEEGEKDADWSGLRRPRFGLQKTAVPTLSASSRRNVSTL